MNKDNSNSANVQKDPTGKNLTKEKKMFNFLEDYLSKENCTSWSFGLEPIKQRCFVCPICNPKQDKKICKFCYETCHDFCRASNPGKQLNQTELKPESFSCYCGLKLKHKVVPPSKKELVPCNMMELDQILSVNCIWCQTHNIQVCCICSVTCHKSCKIIYESVTSSQKCACHSDYHTSYNEIALTFPLNEYQAKTGISVWPIQILNILFSTKSVFANMSELFIRTMNDKSVEIDESFFPLLELFSNTLNRKFKTFYFNEELLKMFQYNSVIQFLFRLPKDNGKILLVKFRLIFIVLFIHLKADFQLIKTLTSTDFLTTPILDRFKYKILLEHSSLLTENVIRKYYNNRDEVLMKIALNEACSLMEIGMNYLSVEQNQDEFEIGLKYMCFLLKHMIFTNTEFERLIHSLYSFFDKFIEYFTGDKSNIYGLLSIFNTLAEVFYMICVNYNDNIVRNYLAQGKGDCNGFIHCHSEAGTLLFKMVLKGCDILKKHYALLQKADFDTKSKEEKKREEAMRKHKQRMQEKIESTTTGVKLKLPPGGGLLVEKIIKQFNETLKIFCLADNIYLEQINQINKEDVLEYLDFVKKVSKNKYGTFYNIADKSKNINSHFLMQIKISIEGYLFKLFNGSYTGTNLRIVENILKEVHLFIANTDLIFQNLAKTHSVLKEKGKLPQLVKDDSIDQAQKDYFCLRLQKKLVKYFPFLAYEVFEFQKGNFIDSFILYNFDETISKLPVFFSTRDFPHLLTTELLSEIFGLLELYLLTKDGTQYLLTGKILTRVSKVFRRYCCMKNNKNEIPKFHRDFEHNLAYVELTLNFIYTLSKAIKVYGLSLKHHKILWRYKDHFLEHLEVMSSDNFTKITDKREIVLQVKKHITICLKIFDLLANDFEYDDFEEIKERVMNLFCSSPLDLNIPNKFIQQFSLTDERRETLRVNTSRVLTPRNSFISERDNLIGGGREMMVIESKGDDEGKEYDLNKQTNIKMYLAFFSIISKNTYYAYINSKEEKLYEQVLKFNSIDDFKTLLHTYGNVNNMLIKIPLKDRITILEYLRSLSFLEHLDRITLFKKKHYLTNQEYKQMIFNNIIHIDGLEDAVNSGKGIELDSKEINEMKSKLIKIDEISSVIDLFIMELTSFPNQCQNETVSVIESFLKLIVFSCKFIADFYFTNYDLVNKLSLKFYFLTKHFLEKSNLIMRMLKDIQENHNVSQNYEKIENPRLSEISFSNYDVYDKFLVYKYISEEIELIFKETNINEECSLQKYLDDFDNLAESNFTPFSLIEVYDYEYFYQEASNEEEEILLKNKTYKLIHKIPTVFIEEFIDITSTNFYQVITSLSNESIRADYRKKMVNYFHAFFNSNQSHITHKLELLICIICKMMFYDGEEMQTKFNKMRTDKFFFPNLNSQLHQYIILTIISSKNSFVYPRAMRMVSLTKLMIQFIQLLGEGFNIEFHDNIFRLQKDILKAGIFSDEGDSEQSESSLNEDENDDNDDLYEEDDEDEDEYDQIEVSDVQTEHSRKSKKNKTNISSNNRLISKEDIVVYVDETIYNTLLINLKRIFGILDLSKEINSELPFDKLIVLTTNIIDFLIEFIDTSDDKVDFIIKGMDLLFFGDKISKRDSYYTKMDKKGVVSKALFTKIDNAKLDECSTRKKLICYVKIKYLQLLISFLQTGKHEDTVIKMIEHRCSTIELYNEVLFNFHYLIMQIQDKDEKIYKKLISKQSDESFVQQLIHIYVHEEIFKDIIEFSLCLKLYVLIRTYEEIYGQTMLKEHFEKLMSVEFKQNEELSLYMNIDINSFFSKRVYMFLEQLVLKVEVKNNSLFEDENKAQQDQEKIEAISEKIAYEIKKVMPSTYNLNEEEEIQLSSELEEKNQSEIPETKTTFFVRPHITFYLSNQSMKNFEDHVDRTNATSKFMELIQFTDYSLLEMVINMHLIGDNSFAKFMSSLDYFYIELINFLIILIHNILIMYHFYRSPTLSDDLYNEFDKDKLFYVYPGNFYLSIIQIIFIGIVLINWIWFKMLLTYQRNIMKRYNRNFIFRKKNQDVSENMSPTIVRYFQESGSSAFSVIREKNRSVSFFQAAYVFLIESFLLNREICMLIYTVILVSIYLKVKSSLLIVIPMIFIANITPTLFDIFKAIKMKFSSMMTVLLFTCLVVYIYAWITLFYLSFLFDFDEIVERKTGEGIHEAFCSSSLQCLLYMVQEGLKSGEGIGGILPFVSYRQKPGFFIARFFYDMIFFIFIIMILFNVFMGIIVDTFAELRDINWNRENDINNICFICQLSRDDCLTRNIDFENHVKKEHYVWNYVYFLSSLHTSNPNDFNSIENFVWEKLEEQDFGWIPISSSAE